MSKTSTKPFEIGYVFKTMLSQNEEDGSTITKATLIIMGWNAVVKEIDKSFW